MTELIQLAFQYSPYTMQYLLAFYGERKTGNAEITDDHELTSGSKGGL